MCLLLVRFSGIKFIQQMLQYSGTNVCCSLTVCVSCAGNDALCPNWQIKVHLSRFRCLQSKQTLTLPCSPVRCVYLVTTLTRGEDWTLVWVSATNRKVTHLCIFFCICTSHEAHVYLCFLLFVVVSVTTKSVISSTGIFVAIANNILYGSKLTIFILCQKLLGY